MIKNDDNGADRAVLVLHLRRSRLKSREAAVAEVVACIRDLDAHSLPGGPLSETSGIAWVGCRSVPTAEIADRLRSLGYTRKVDVVLPASGERTNERLQSFHRRGRDVMLKPIYHEEDEHLQLAAPDRRSFLLECGDQVVRRIEGYRGGRGPLEHRALPVSDARLLINLVSDSKGCILLDPFAGAGGLVIAARMAGWTTMSVDADPAVRFGLTELADEHVVADATRLPFHDSCVDAVATEPPYDESAMSEVIASIGELSRVLRPGGRASMLVSRQQASAIREAALTWRLDLELDVPIDRKGLEVQCVCMRKF